MLDALVNLVCLITIFTCLHLGSRIAWSCGNQCKFSKSPETKRQAILKSIPAATTIYSFGFFIAFNYYIEGLLPRVVISLTSATILAILVVSMAMPELKRKPPREN